ncbi:hypothetical protein ABU16_3708 [Bacillus subtilis]|nr:hypothetical protein ABU16_3708 [Bacillus subtilis]
MPQQEDSEGGWRIWEQNIKRACVMNVEQCSWSKDAQRLGSMMTAFVSIISSVLGVGLSIHPITPMLT